MKIVEVIPHLKSGGGEKLVVDLSNEFARMGHECIVLTLFAPKADDILYGQLNNDVRKENLGKRLGNDFKSFTRFLRFVRKENPEVVHLHLGAIKYSLLAALFCRKTKFFATIHSEAKREAGLGFEKYVRKLLFGTKLVKPITISPESDNSFLQFYGYRGNMIPNGVSPYMPKDNTLLYRKYHKDVEYLFVHAGRIHPVKNQKMLISAFEQLIDEGYSCRLLLLGRGEPGDLLEYVKAHTSDKIVYIGEVPNVRDYMAVSDCFCLSSHQEGLPITILEAYTTGCPVVSTPVGGCINVVKDKQTGFLTEAVEIKSYVDTLKKLMTLSKEELLRFKQQSLEEYESFYSIRNCAERHIKLFSII